MSFVYWYGRQYFGSQMESEYPSNLLATISLSFFLIVIFYLFIYSYIYFWLCWVFVSVRGLSLVVASGGHSSSRCAGPFTMAASLLAEHRLQTRRLNSCGSRAQPLRGMGDLTRPGLEPVSPALAGRFSTTAPPGKPSYRLFLKIDKKLIFNCQKMYVISLFPWFVLQLYLLLIIYLNIFLFLKVLSLSYFSAMKNV